MDARTLSLPNDQDALVSAVAAANPHTIVVLETGGPVSMPWVNDVAGIFETWYPGIGGAEALANLLFGDVNPTAKLPATFAKSDADLPHPAIAGMDLKEAPHPVATNLGGHRVMHNEMKLPPFDVDYNVEGARVGYKWFESKHIQPLFPFGFGLSYTTYEYSGIKVTPDGSEVTLTVKNTGSRAGAEIAQVYARLPQAAGEDYQRLVAFNRIPLAPGESKTVTMKIDPTLLSIFDEAKDGWDLLPGEYKFAAGPSSSETPLTTTIQIAK
jgi:beta-glucosidase